jgi:hypothetical protein
MAISGEQEARFIAQLRRILPSLFDQREGAQILLVDIGRAQMRQPGWHTPEAFWHSELRELERGAVEDGIVRLIRAAAERYPANQALLGMLQELDTAGVQGMPEQPEDGDEPEVQAGKPDLPPPQIVEQFHTLTLMGSDRHDDFLRLVRRLVDPAAEICYATTAQSGQLPMAAVLISDPGAAAGDVERRVHDEMQGWGEGVSVEYQTSQARPYLLRRIVVDGTDNRRFELRNVPSTTPLEEIARAVLQNYTGDGSRPRRERVRTAVDRVRPDGSADRLDLGRTLSDAGVQDGDELRLATEATAGRVPPALWRESVLRAQLQINQYARNHPGFVIAETDDPNLPTRYTIEFTARGFAPPTDPEAWPLSPPLQSEHRVVIVLPADFPVRAPAAVFLTEIFHPNVLAAPVKMTPKGFACLGALQDAYRPDMDFGQLCQMLVDMASYQQYETREMREADGEGYLNLAAARWARSDAGQQRIADRGGARMPIPAGEDDAEKKAARSLPLDIRPLDNEWEVYEDEG